MLFPRHMFMGCAAVAIAMIPLGASAHGTMQKIVEGKYLVNLSSAPIAPYVGQEQQNILAISDTATDSLIEKNIVFDLEIHKDNATVFTAKHLVATGGLLGFKHTYEEAGMYELFVKFRMPDSSQVYEPEDYWIQVVPKAEAAPEQAVPQVSSLSTIVIAVVIAVMAGFLLGALAKRG